MEDSNNLQSIHDYALEYAIKNHDVSMTEKCLSAGSTFTSNSLDVLLHEMKNNKITNPKKKKFIADCDIDTMVDYINGESFNEKLRREFDDSKQISRSKDKEINKITMSKGKKCIADHEKNDIMLDDYYINEDMFYNESRHQISHSDDDGSRHHMLQEIFHSEDEYNIDERLRLESSDSDERLRHHVFSSEDVNVRKVNLRTERFGKIFKLLLKNRMDIMISDVDFMSNCIMYCDTYYIKSMIDTGYNGNHHKSLEIFNKILELLPSPFFDRSKIEILLQNGFCHHIQSILMKCIKSGNCFCMELFVKYGANFYSILHDINAYVERSFLDHSQRTTVEIALENMYNITMLSEPIHKYFLIKSGSYDVDVPNEIFVYILQIYMEMDFVCTINIKQKLSEYQEFLSDSYQEFFSDPEYSGIYN